VAVDGRINSIAQINRVPKRLRIGSFKIAKRIVVVVLLLILLLVFSLTKFLPTSGGPLLLPWLIFGVVRVVVIDEPATPATPCLRFCRLRGRTFLKRTSNTLVVCDAIIAKELKAPDRPTAIPVRVCFARIFYNLICSTHPPELLRRTASSSVSFPSS
jgi:hypothetical protein